MDNLRIPVPTPCPPEVLQAMTKQMINHRGEEFIGILNGVTDKLKQLFQQNAHPKGQPLVGMVT